MFTRRSMLKTGLAASLAGIMPIPGMTSLAFADGREAKPLLIVLHLRGGCDGLNLISPASDPAFIDARVTELRVATDGPDVGFQLANGPDPATDFRLHSAASGLADLYQSNQLAFIHAVGLSDATRSHFVATDMIEHGVSSAGALGHVNNGWLTRALQQDTGARPFALAVSGVEAADLSGFKSAVAVSDISGGLAPSGGPAVTSMLDRFYAGAPGQAGNAGRMALASLNKVDSHIPRDGQQKIIAYKPENGVNYAGTAEFERPLRTLAQLVKMDIGLEVATIDLGGWDTHEYQAPRFKQQVTKLSNGVAALWNDLSAYHDRITLVTLTEFGRRFRSNRSNGTDHGRASVMAVLGGRVRGGRFYGAWPGLHPDALDEGVDLRVATDYRQPLSEILDHRAGHRVDGVFPNYTSPGALGFMA